MCLVPPSDITFGGRAGQADRVRPNYMLKEAKLVELLVKALNISGDEAKKAQNWWAHLCSSGRPCVHSIVHVYSVELE